MKRYPFAGYLSLCVLALCVFSAMGQDSTATIPLQLKIVNTSVLLRWNTLATEEDSADFIIERSRDARSFEVLSQLKLSRLKNDSGFLFIDNFPFADSAFYRVSWLSRPDKPVYSEIIGALFPVQPRIEFNIMPNPVFNNATLIIYHEELGDISCTLYDMTGKSIRSYQFKKTTAYIQHILDMYTVPKGSYILNIRGTTINESKRLLKQ